MKETKIANRYAKALFELAIELNQLEETKADAQLVYDVCRQNHDLILMFRSPIIKPVKKIAIIKEIFEKKLNTLTLNFLIIITRNRRDTLIMDIAEQFIVIYKKYKNIISANLTTAVKVDEETKNNIISLLKKHTKAEIDLTEFVDDQLIGGFVLTFDDMQYDASLQRQIQNLKQDFKKNLYIKGF